MIGALQGSVFYKADNNFIIMVGGVGYSVEGTADMETYAVGDAITVFTYTHVREDILKLYAFCDREDLQAFSMLLSVSGIGPKSAMNIVSSLKAAGLYGAILHEDKKAFKGISGIGAKGIEKIFLELKGKVEKQYKQKPLPAGTRPVVTDDADLANALTALGYSAQEIKAVEEQISLDAPLPEMIKEALHLLRK